MPNYTPIRDLWICARPKVPYYGSYPAGFLEKARALLAVTEEEILLHVCGGRVRDYPFRGVGQSDMTVDLDIRLKPDYLMDVRFELPTMDGSHWRAILADPPYSEADAAHYAGGAESYPEPGPLLKRCLEHVRIGGRVGMLHFEWPRPPADVARPVALVGVITGWGARIRAYSVFERLR